jgi:hypothetical protein
MHIISLSSVIVLVLSSLARGDDDDDDIASSLGLIDGESCIISFQGNCSSVFREELDADPVWLTGGCKCFNFGMPTEQEVT